MGEREVKDKLIRKLASVPSTEEDVVYVLSRIRKVIEMDGKKKEDAVLNFYCNLTLHCRIDCVPAAVRQKLVGMIAGESYRGSVIGFEEFHSALRGFLDRHGLPNFYFKATSVEIRGFNSALLDVWSHTPVWVKGIDNYEMVLRKTTQETLDIEFNYMPPKEGK